MNSWARAARAAAMICARGVRPAVGDVLGDRAVEQERLLQHDADVAAVFLDREGADVGAVDRDRPFGDVVEAADEVDDRGLARPARPDQPDHLARPDGKVHFLQDGAGPIVELNVVELDFPLQSPGMHGIHRLGDAGDAIENGENALALAPARCTAATMRLIESMRA